MGVGSLETDPLPSFSSDDPDWDGPDRRASERRKQPTRPWARWLGPLRREQGRRRTDRVGYVDRYSRREVALILAVFLMNVADAFLTLLWLERGGQEANPFMDFFLDIGPGAFLVQKCGIVGIWLVILLVHKNFRFARLGLYASLVVYAALMLVHFGILAFDVAPPPDPRDIARSKALLERQATIPTGPIPSAPGAMDPARPGAASGRPEPPSATPDPADPVSSRVARPASG